MFGDVAALAPWSRPPGCSSSCARLGGAAHAALEDLRDFFPQLVKRFTRLARRPRQQGQLSEPGARAQQRTCARAGPPSGISNRRPSRSGRRPSRRGHGWPQPRDRRRVGRPGKDSAAHLPGRPHHAAATATTTTAELQLFALQREQRARPGAAAEAAEAALRRLEEAWGGAARDGEAAAAWRPPAASVVAEAEVAPVRVEGGPGRPPRRAPLRAGAPPPPPRPRRRVQAAGAHHLVDPLDAAVAAHLPAGRHARSRPTSGASRRPSASPRWASWWARRPAPPRARRSAPAPRNPRCAAGRRRAGPSSRPSSAPRSMRRRAAAAAAAAEEEGRMLALMQAAAPALDGHDPCHDPRRERLCGGALGELRAGAELAHVAAAPTRTLPRRLRRGAGATGRDEGVSAAAVPAAAATRALAREADHRAAARAQRLARAAATGTCSACRAHAEAGWCRAPGEDDGLRGCHRGPSAEGRPGAWRAPPPATPRQRRRRRASLHARAGLPRRPGRRGDQLSAGLAAYARTEAEAGAVGAGAALRTRAATGTACRSGGRAPAAGALRPAGRLYAADLYAEGAHAAARAAAAERRAGRHRTPAGAARARGRGASPSPPSGAGGHDRQQEDRRGHLRRPLRRAQESSWAPASGRRPPCV